MIPSQRHLFEIPDDIAYLNMAYLSPLMHSVREAGERGVARKVAPWDMHLNDFYDEVEVARAAFARLIGADADDVAIAAAASYGLQTAAINLPVDQGRRILILADQFPSNVYVWQELARRRNAELVTLPRPEDWDWTEALLGAIDERAAIVALPNCHWTDGSLIDLERVGARCREVGAALVVDVTQSLGAWPLDVGAVRPDFLVCATYKWLLGPYSLGFLYVAPERQEGEPLEYTPFSRAHANEPEEWSGGELRYRDDYLPGARRFDVGERANFALMPMAIAAIDQILDWGVPEIAETLAAMTGRIAEYAAERGLIAPPAAARADHMIGLRFGEGSPGGLQERLEAERVHVSVRANSIRISPHLYNTHDDLDRLFKVLDAVV
jgi:selenocysteine lyase/cysteine desulfurase